MQKCQDFSDIYSDLPLVETDFLKREQRVAGSSGFYGVACSAIAGWGRSGREAKLQHWGGREPCRATAAADPSPGDDASSGEPGVVQL